MRTELHHCRCPLAQAPWPTCPVLARRIHLLPASLDGLAWVVWRTAGGTCLAQGLPVLDGTLQGLSQALDMPIHVLDCLDAALEAVVMRLIAPRGLPHVSSVRARVDPRARKEPAVMNLALLRQQLIVDEGRVLHVYPDTAGYPTCGIGHCCTRHDGLHLGDPISDHTCERFYAADVQAALETCRHLWQAWDDFPEEVQQVTANMAFHLGARRLATFKRFIAALDAGAWRTAAREGRDSQWYRQVPQRAERLMARLDAVATAQEEPH